VADFNAKTLELPVLRFTAVRDAPRNLIKAAKRNVFFMYNAVRCGRISANCWYLSPMNHCCHAYRTHSAGNARLVSGVLKGTDGIPANDIVCRAGSTMFVARSALSHPPDEM